MAKIAKKILVILIVFVLTGLNFITVGANISIAAEESNEEDEEIQVEIEQNVEKYLMLNEEETLLQESVNVKISGDAKRENERIELETPKIQGQSPKSVQVILNRTRLRQWFC